MIERRLIEALNDCINRLATGQTVEDCLRAHPDVADELHSLLATGQAVSRVRASAADVRAMRSRLDTRIDSLIEKTDFQSSHLRLSQGSMVLLVAVVVLILVGLWLFLRHDKPQVANDVSPTLVTESPITQAPVETTVAPAATESPTPTITPSLTPTSAPTDTPLPSQTATASPSPQPTIDENSTDSADNNDDGAVGNQDEGAVGNQENNSTSD